MSAITQTQVINQITHIIDIVGGKSNASSFLQNSLENLFKRFQEGFSNSIIPPIHNMMHVIPQAPPPTVFSPSYPIPPIVNGDSPSEKARIRNRLAGFKPKESPVWEYMTDRFGAEMNQSKLLALAEMISTQLSIPLDRDAKRRKTVLIKWYHDNWAMILPYIDKIQPEFVDSSQIR